MVIYKERNFSDVDFKQIEFGISDELRLKISRQLENSVKKDLEKRSKEESEVLKSNHIKNKEVEKKAIRYVKNNYNTRVLGIGLGYGNNSYALETSDSKSYDNDDIDFLPDRDGRKISNSRSKNKYQIFFPSNLGTEDLAHEIGHVINRESSVNSKNPIKRRILFRAKDSEKLSKHTNPDRSKYSNDWKDVKEVIKSNVSQLYDESLASKNGLKLLKDLGLSKEELKQAKKNLKHGYNTYKYNNHAAIKMSLSGKILPKEYRPVPGRLKERRRWN